MKNIVLCSDGTGNNDVKARGTNVFKLYEAIDRNGHKSDPTLVPQVAFYDDGVGTSKFIPLGRERTFLVCCKDDKIKIPSDLAGITFATYAKPSDDTKLTSAVGPACTRIRSVIETQGKAAELQKLKNEVKQQESDIRAIRVALNGIVTKFEIDYLR